MRINDQIQPVGFFYDVLGGLLSGFGGGGSGGGSQSQTAVQTVTTTSTSAVNFNPNINIGSTQTGTEQRAASTAHPAVTPAMIPINPAVTPAMIPINPALSGGQAMGTIDIVNRATSPNSPNLPLIIGGVALFGLAAWFLLKPRRRPGLGYRR
jgi:hypothetical protein